MADTCNSDTSDWIGCANGGNPIANRNRHILFTVLDPIYNALDSIQPDDHESMHNVVHFDDRHWHNPRWKRHYFKHKQSLDLAKSIIWLYGHNEHHYINSGRKSVSTNQH